MIVLSEEGNVKLLHRDILIELFSLGRIRHRGLIRPSTMRLEAIGSKPSARPASASRRVAVLQSRGAQRRAK
jgi:hypothetical protein